MAPQTTPRLHVDVGGTTELEFKLAVAGVKGERHGFRRAAVC
jgi:hypothetical protein